MARKFLTGYFPIDSKIERFRISAARQQR